MDITSYLLGVSHGKKSGGNSDIVGAWIFNEELTTPEDFFNKTFYIKASLLQDDAVCTVNHFDFEKIDDCYIITLYDDGGSCSIDDWYISDEGWFNKTCRFICILEEPSAEIAEWIRANATKLS